MSRFVMWLKGPADVSRLVYGLTWCCSVAGQIALCHWLGWI